MPLLLLLPLLLVDFGANAEPVKKVHLVFTHHLDVGLDLPLKQVEGCVRPLPHFSLQERLKGACVVSTAAASLLVTPRPSW